MSARLFLRSAGRQYILDRPFGCSAMILGVTACYLGISVLVFAIWHITGNDAWIEQFFRVAGALLLVSLSAVELVFSLQVRREFSPGQMLHKAWSLIAFSAGCGMVGALCVQVLSARSVLNPLVYCDWWSEGVAVSIRQFGLIAGGTCRYALLAAGLPWVLKVYRNSGFLGRLKAIDRILIVMFGCYVASEALDVVRWWRAGTRFSPGMMLGWPVDILLWGLLAGAMRLNRSVEEMGEGWIGRCWRAFSTGTFLVLLGDVAIFAAQRGYLPWPWSALGWLVWIPAAGAFALGPTYQLEAIYQARSLEPGGPPGRWLLAIRQR